MRLVSRPPSRRRLAVEALESRNLLSLTARLAADLNTVELGSSPRDFVALGDSLYFLAEIWGTPALWAFNPASVTPLTNVGSARTPPTPLADTFYFSANPDGESPELWQFHSADGVRMAADLAVGPHSDYHSEPRELTVFDGRLYFAAYLDSRGDELWTLDGEIVRVAANINPEGPPEPEGYVNPAHSSPTELIVVGDALYFVAYDGANYSLWKFDGQSASRVPSVAANSHSFTAFQGQLYFLTTDPSGTATELWRFDGQQATLVGALPFSVGGAASVVFNNELYFAAFDAIPNSGNQFTLLRSDGTRFERVPDVPGLTIAEMAVFNDELYFAAADQATGVELWKYDGQTATRVTDINPSGDAITSGFAVYQGELYFGATDSQASSAEVWKFDGTTVRRAIDVRPGNASAYVTNLTVVDDTLHFNANNGVGHWGLWAFDGQTATPASPSPLVGYDKGPRNFAVAGNSTYFVAGSDFTDAALWRIENGLAVKISDDCGGGCRVIAPYDGVVAFRDEIFFTAKMQFNNDVWKFDGDAFTGFPQWPANDIANANVLGDHLYLVSQRIWNEWSVIRYDGTRSEVVTHLFPEQPALAGAVEFAGRWYFTVFDGSASIWSTDLTVGGARRETDLAGLSVALLTVINGKLHFLAHEGDFRFRIWRLENGHATPLSNPGVYASGPILPFGDWLLFTGSTPESGTELWAYDGQSTFQVADIAPGAASSDPSNLTVWRDAVYFSAVHPLTGRELWTVTIDRDADLDGDGAVSVADAVVLQRNLGIQFGATLADGDLDGDGAITPLDAAILVKQFGRRAPITASAPALASVTESIRTSVARRITATRVKAPPEPSAVDVALTTALDSSRLPARRTRKR